MEPEELQHEQRWSRVTAADTGRWSQQTDQRLVQLVMSSTASGERFPVGVNWLDVARIVGHSPVDCVKRYALLYAVREQQDASHQASNEASNEASATVPAERDSNLEQTQFSGLSISSEEGGSPRRDGSFIDYCSPIPSPKLDAFDTFEEEFGVGSPKSPPPFAAHESKLDAPSSPLRWENLANEPLAGGSPVVRSLRRMHAPSGAFGIEEEAKTPGSRSPDGVRSPRIIHGTQDHTSPFANPEYAANILNHAFKGVGIGSPPAVTSPRMIRTISNSEYPFAKDDDTKNPFAPASTAARVSDTSPISKNQQQPANQSMMSNVSSAQMSMMSNMSSFHGDNPFSGSLTQSALEDAFLDMAGSRLDASNVLLNSRFSMTQSRQRLEQIQAQKERGPQAK